MKLNYLLVLLAVAAKAGAGVPLFSGVSSFSGHTYFSLKQEKTSAWLEIGETIGAYTLKEFDPASQTLTLTSQGESIKLGLDPERTKDSPAGSASAHGMDLAQLLIKSGAASPALKDLFERYRKLDEKTAELARKLAERAEAHLKEQEAEKDKKTDQGTGLKADRFDVGFSAEKREVDINTEILGQFRARISEAATEEYARLGASGGK